jgi:hypothetical protein
LLEFELLQGRHTGENLAGYVYDILETYKLKTKLFCITTDNATNNDTLTASLEDRLANEDMIVFDPSEQHIPCVAHVLNLAVQTFLRNLKVLNVDSETTADDGDELEAATLDPEKDFAVTMTKIRNITKV